MAYELSYIPPEFLQDGKGVRVATTYVFKTMAFESESGKTEVTCRISGRSHFEFPLLLPPERAFETLTAPHPYRSLMWMHAYRHNSSAGFCGRSFLDSDNNNRDDRAPPVSRELADRLS